jgi:hypothetical protein
MKFTNKHQKYKVQRQLLKRKYQKWNSVAQYLNWALFMAISLYIVFIYDFKFLDILTDSFKQFESFYYWLYQIPIDIHISVVSLYRFFEEWAIKLWEGKSWYQVSLFIFWGVLRRLVIEDIIIPTLTQYYFTKIARALKVYVAIQQIKIAQFSKSLRLTVSLIFVGPLSFVTIIFKGLSGAWFFIQKFVINKVLTFIKMIFLKWLPLLLTALFDLFPILQFLIEFAFLRILIEKLRKYRWFIPFHFIITWITYGIDVIGRFLDMHINRRIGKGLQYLAIKTKFFLRSRIRKNNFDTKHLNDILLRKARFVAIRKARKKLVLKETTRWKVKKWLVIILTIIITIVSIYLHF